MRSSETRLHPPPEPAVVAVLGGSSPFTVGLVDAMGDVAAGLAAGELRLQGRDESALENVTTYARARLEPLGWRVHATSDRACALDGAAFVIHQPRYGGLAGRLQAEELVARHGIAADETLGPAGLFTAVRWAEEIRACARAIQAGCPDAWVVNLRNPLSVTVTLLARFGIERCIGVCELPAATAKLIAAALGVPLRQLEWSYSGLNHRGFLHDLSVDSRDALAPLVETLRDGRTLGGIAADELAELGAVPLKYFALLRQPHTDGRRAAALARLRRQVARELREAPTVTPPALTRRPLEWYRSATVPALAALSARDGRIEIMTLPGSGDVAQECKVAVTLDGPEATAQPPLPAGARRWLDLFAEHERRVVAAALDPSAGRIRDALECDPLVPPSAVAPLTGEIGRLARGPSTDRVRPSRRRRSADPAGAHVVLQAGGRGSRLRPLTDQTPKPLLPVAGVPMLERLLRQLVAGGYPSYTVVTGWLGDDIEKSIASLDGLPPDIRIGYVRETDPLGTVGALALLPAPEGPLLHVFGDLVTALDFVRLLEVHVDHGADVTLASHIERHRLRLGEIVADGEEVMGYAEKPAKEFLICSGIAVLEPGVVQLAGALRPPVGLGDLVTAAIRDGRRVIHWQHGAFWRDVNSPEALEEAAAAVAATDGHGDVRAVRRRPTGATALRS